MNTISSPVTTLGLNLKVQSCIVSAYIITDGVGPTSGQRKRVVIFYRIFGRRELYSPDNITWTGTFTPTDNKSDLTNTLKLKENSYTDIANNYGNQPYAKWSYDNTTTNYVVDTGAAVKLKEAVGARVSTS